MPLGLERRGLAWQQSMKNAVGLREVAGAAVPGAARACPVVTAGSGYFDGEGRPYVVRMELPLSAGEMKAAMTLAGLS